MNTALINSYNNFIAANPGSTTIRAPIMRFNSEDDSFSIIIHQSYVTEGVRLFFNTALYSLFFNSFNVRNFGRNRLDKKDVEIIIQDQGRGTPPFYELRQQVTTLNDWFDFQSIIFTNNSLPIKAERISTRSSDGRSINQAIITDFIPELGRDRSNFIYNANPYRWIDMSGQQPVDKFDFRVEYVNKNGELRPLFIEPGYSMNVKFIFMKKDLSK